MRQPGEQLDGRSLRADDLAADDPLDDAQVADAPGPRALIELRERLRELVEILVVAGQAVDVDERQPLRAAQLVERLTGLRDDAPHLVPPGRVEAAAVP